MLQPNAYWAAFAGSVARVASVSAIVLGCLVLAGWGLGLAVLQSLLPGLPTMKINTALSLMLAGLSLWSVLTEAGGSAWRRLCAYGGAALVALLGWPHWLNICSVGILASIRRRCPLFQRRATRSAPDGWRPPRP